ncbi:unnamed protein product [Echinostoma caproni]|uniref:CPSF73-100_C domain-containing protein n=1 Tax=Echinostoma caproni TaxID=27848 RepID=A0A183B8X7_9TREM|nr:unnamed protein product [Echinostoma caproni]
MPVYALNFLAHVDPSQPPSEGSRIQPSFDIGIQATKLLDLCEVERLSAAFTLISGNADQVSLTSLEQRGETDQAEQQEDANKHQLSVDMSTGIIEHVSLITPTDLNILVSSK